MTRRRNLHIDVFRFIFACVVFLYHFRTYSGAENQVWYFKGGYLGVEFFFMVAGYYLMKGIDIEEKEGEKKLLFKELKQFAVSKYKKLYPEYIVSIILLIAASFVTAKEYHSIYEFISILPDMLCIQVFFNNPHVNSLLWFVSSLIWGSLIIKLIILISKNKRNTYCIMTVASVIGFVIMFVFVGNLDINQNKVFYLDGFVRGCIEMVSGSTIGVLVTHIKKNDRYISASLIKLGFYASGFIILAYMFGGGDSRADFILLIFIYVLIFSAELMEAEVKGRITYSVAVELGAISYSLYLNQVLIQKIIHSFFPGRNYWGMAVLSLVISVICAYIVHKTIILFYQIVGRKQS